MLEFEFIQPGEFEDPYYEVTNEEYGYIGRLRYEDKWGIGIIFYGTSYELDQISAKLKELNKKGSK